MYDRSNPIKAARIVPVIKVFIKKGQGTDGDPVRYVTQYWEPDGSLIAELDEQKRTSE